MANNTEVAETPSVEQHDTTEDDHDCSDTDIVPDEYYWTRNNDCTPGFGVDDRPKLSRHQRHELLIKIGQRWPEVDLPGSEWERDPTGCEDEQLASAGRGVKDIGTTMKEGTQPLTQQIEDGRQRGKHLSDISDGDLTDIICLLNPQSNLAHAAVKQTMLYGPQHIHQNDDLDDLEEFDLSLPQYQEPREFALRLSSAVKSPKDGFVFGRNTDVCDLLLTDDPAEKLISNKHFKIYVNGHGSLMLQDTSTNGTIVDDQHLRARRKDTMQKPPSLALKSGTIISLVSGPTRMETKFLVRIPNRGGFEDEYERNLRKYLAARGTVANFASMRESIYGNHWNGGELYNFAGIVGKGAFASVYRVQTKRDGYYYAAKELDKRRFIKNGILDIKFDNELKIMQNLKHPNIVEYIDCQNYENWVYIIMELLPHGELSSELRSRTFLPENEVQQITRQILHALYYLHQRGVTHRDIKPDNILIASRDPLIVKLSDFGLSKCVTDQETFLKTFCGTLLYCAPEVYPDYTHYAQGSMPKRRRIGEQAARPSKYNDSVDTWSFGAVIFHLLCGKAPITGRGDDRGAQMLNNIMTKEVDFEPLRTHGISDSGIDFVRSLLNRDPLSRPKEPECLQHPWLRDVADVIEYADEETGADLFRRALDSVDEAPERDLDEDMMQELSQYADLASQHSTSPQRAHKRMRTEQQTGAEEVQYPNLPAHSQNSTTENPPNLPQVKLFGEITPSVLKSSGLFGAPLGAGNMNSQSSDGVEAVTQGHEATRAIQYGLENISVNDWLSREDSDINMNEVDFPLPPGRTLAAPSLLGAEAGIGNLQMTSHSGGIANRDANEMDVPIASNKKPMVPADSIRRPSNGPGSVTQFIDFDGRFGNENMPPSGPGVEPDHRVVSPSRKAETFQGRGTSYEEVPLPLAHSMDTAQARVPGSRGPSQDASPGYRRGPSQLQRTSRFGQLTSLPGSYIDIEIPLLQRETAWGRSPACTYQHTDLDDILIARIALKVHFHARGVEEVEKAGGDWTKVKGIETLISTSTSTYICINGVKLRKSSEGEHNFLYGKLYHDDIVTVVDELQGQGKQLSFKVEILFGDSARPRPNEESGFIIQSMRTEKWKEHLLEGKRNGTVVMAS